VIGVVIALAFVYLLLSLFATWIQELIATLLSWRSKELVNAIQNLLDPSTDKLAGVKKLEQQWGEGAGVVQKLRTNFVKAFYESPVVRALGKPNRRPSYIPSREFGHAVFDLVVKAGTADSPMLKGLEAFKEGAAKLGNENTRDALLSFAESAELKLTAVEGRIAAVRGRISEWFDAAMERASGWYKRRLQVLAVIVGVLLAVAFNADTILLTTKLWHESQLRSLVNASALRYLESGQSPEAIAVLQELESLELPIGWGPGNIPQPEHAPLAVAWLLRVLGWILTGFAVSQGSPIWFDVLNRFVNLRGSGKKPAAA
jgi:hypothetical protein